MPLLHELKCLLWSVSVIATETRNAEASLGTILAMDGGDLEAIGHEVRDARSSGVNLPRCLCQGDADVHRLAVDPIHRKFGNLEVDFPMNSGRSEKGVSSS